MLVLVCYDIGDVAGDGSVRLRRVAEACLNHGTRVQFSVFECRLSEALWIGLRARLLSVFDGSKDSLRFYFLCETDERKVEKHGRTSGIDPTGPLIV